MVQPLFIVQVKAGIGKACKFLPFLASDRVRELPRELQKGYCPRLILVQDYTFNSNFMFFIEM